MRRAPICLVLICLLCLWLCACGGQEPPPISAREVLTAMQAVMTETAQPLPDGLLYTRAADPSSPAYLTDIFFSALYGEAARGLLDGDAMEGTPSATEGSVPAVGDAAIFLSVAPYPCELAVFRCSDIRTATTVAGLCRGRLDAVARGYAGSEWQPIAERGRVAVEGCYVFLVIAEDPQAVLETATGMVR